MDTLLFTLFLGTPLWLWFTFIGIVVALLAFDLGVLNKGDHEIGVAESLKLSALYITLGLAFGGFVWWQFGAQSAAEYLTAFVVEKTLALDNVFVIALIFSYFAIPRALSAPRAVLGHPGRDRAARHHDRPRRHAGRAVRLGALHLRGLPDLHRHQDAGDRRQGDRPRPQIRCCAFMRKRFRVTDGLHGNAFFVREARSARPAGRCAGSRRCSWRWC